MSDADSALAVQKAAIDAMKASAALTAIVGARVYTRPPAGATKPYVSLGPVQVIAELADDYEGSDVRLQIDAWSAQPESTAEIMQIGRAIRAALQGASLTVAGQHLVLIEVEQTRYLTDPDGLTQHAVVIVRSRTEPSA